MKKGRAKSKNAEEGCQRRLETTYIYIKLQGIQFNKKIEEDRK